MDSFLHKVFHKKFSTCATIIGMFSYTILLDQDFACTCRPQVWECPTYMSLPFFIVFFLTLWGSRSFLRVCRYTCSTCGSEGCCFLLSSSGKLLEAVSVSLLWVVFVLIDGDWYVCCHNDRSDEEELLACKAAGKITEREQGRISELKNTSRVLGGGLLLGIILVGFVWKLWVRVKCCRNSTCCNRKYLYYRLILKEEEVVLKEVLKKSAHHRLTKEIYDRIHGENWERCFNVAEDLIRTRTKPEASEPDQQSTETQEPGGKPEGVRLQMQGSQEEAELSV